VSAEAAADLAAALELGLRRTLDARLATRFDVTSLFFAMVVTFVSSAGVDVDNPSGEQ
jgi:hypothetical protein